jgi:hypothetical protein
MKSERFSTLRTFESPGSPWQSVKLRRINRLVAQRATEDHQNPPPASSAIAGNMLSIPGECGIIPLRVSELVARKSVCFRYCIEQIGDPYEDRNCALPDVREQQGPGRESRGPDQEAARY